MEKETIIAKIKSLFNEVEEVVKSNFISLETKDGLVIEVSELIEGANITYQEGEEVLPLVDAEVVITYEDKDWTIKTDDLGNIASIEEVIVEEVAPVEEEMEGVAPVVEEGVAPVVEEGVSEIELLRNEVKELKDIISKFNKIKQENTELKEKFAKLPAGNSVVKEIRKLNFETTKPKENLPIKEWVKTLER